MAKYVVLGGGGSFGLHTSRYLLGRTDPEHVIAIGRNAPKQRSFALGIGDDDPGSAMTIRATAITPSNFITSKI